MRWPEGACADLWGIVRVQRHRVAVIALLAGFFAPVALSWAAPKETIAEQPWKRWIPDRWNGAGLESEKIIPPERWWAEFNSAELEELVQIALSNNFNLQTAVSRIAQAEARSRATKAGHLPTVDAVVRSELRAPEFGIGTAPTRADYATREIYQAGLRVGYEVDLWGRGAYETQSALARVKASYYAREALAETLVSDVTTNYFTVLALRERVKFASDNVAVAEAIEAALKKRMMSGDVSVFEYEQQGLATADALARLYDLRRSLASAEGDLAFLLGRPVSLLEVRGASLRDIHVPVIHPGLPSDLLCRRPDLREAEAELAAANADVAVARKSLMPTINLTGEGGYGVSSLYTALAPQALFTDLVGQFAQSIFDGGRRKDEIAERQGRERELIEAYQSTVLGALRDTEEALMGVQMTEQRQQVLTQAAERAQRLVELTNKVFNRGATDAVGLLESQRTAYRTGDLAVSARLDRLRAAVDVYKALGGGQVMDGACSIAVAGTAAPAPSPKKSKRW